MAENHEVTATPPQPNNDTLPQPPQHPPSSRDGHEANPSSFVRPSDLLRPRTNSRSKAAAKSDRPIDRDERLGLVSQTPFAFSYHTHHPENRSDSKQKKIRDFLRVRNCYEVLPLSFRLIELDVGLTVRESLNILVSCGMVYISFLNNDTLTERSN